MNAPDSQPARARRWRIWWLALPLVPLTVFAAVVGFDQLQAQQQRLFSPQRNDALQAQEPRNQPAATIQPAFPQRTDRPPNPVPAPYLGTASDSFAPGPNFRPSHDQRRPVQESIAQTGFDPRELDPARKLANELRRLDPQSDGYDAKLAELEEAVAKQFDDRHQQQKLQLSEAQQRLMQLQLDWKNREAAKEQIVTRRINELLGEPDPLRWDAAPLNTPFPGMSYPTPVGATQAAGGSPARNIPESVQADDIHRYATPVPYPNSAHQQAVPVSPGSRTFRPLTRLSAEDALAAPPTRQPINPKPDAVQDANRVASELAQCIQEINAKQVELRRLPQLYRPDAVAEAEPRLAAELTARRQQQKLLELQLEQFEKQTELQHEHARQALENAEKRLQVAQESLDDSNPTSHRQQQRDIAEAETMLLQALQQMAVVELQMDHLKRLRDTVGKVNQQELTEPEDTEDGAEAEEAGDAAEAVAY